MIVHQEKTGASRHLRLRRWIKLTAPVVALIALLWLAAWLVQRSYNSSIRQRQLQDWLDQSLNADVSQLGRLRLRVNVVRNSRLYINKLEVEHPNPLFPGTFLTLGEIVARVPFYALFRLKSGDLSLNILKLRALFEQNEMGEWNADGFMQPLSQRRVAFPFPIPALSGFSGVLRESELVIRRRGYEIRFALDLGMEYSGESRRFTIRAANIPFTFTHLESGKTFNSTISSSVASVLFASGSAWPFRFSPENCEFRIDNLSMSALPFFFAGLPAEMLPGTLAGLLRIADDGKNGTWATLEGEIRDMPLTLFGLPRKAPIRLRIPLGASSAERAATVRLGPSGYGGFDLNIPINEQGKPKGLSMHGDIISIEDVASVFSDGGNWAEWLSSMLPSIVWRARKFVGFGWEGENFRLDLSRSTGGMNLLGEAEMMGGMVKMAVNPGKETPLRVTVAAKDLDAKALTAKLAKLIPEPWAASLVEGKGSLTWRGELGAPNGKGEWNFGFVVNKPEIDVAASGEWWRTFAALPEVLADALPGWGGGSGDELRSMAAAGRLHLEQLSIVSVGGQEDGVRVEFVAQGMGNDEIGGWVEKTGDTGMRGELFYVGVTDLIDAAARANPEMGKVLGMMSNTPVGLQASFTYQPDGGLKFTYPFLREAQRLRGEIDRMSREEEAAARAKEADAPALPGNEKGEVE